MFNVLCWTQYRITHSSHTAFSNESIGTLSNGAITKEFFPSTKLQYHNLSSSVEADHWRQAFPIGIHSLMHCRLGVQHLHFTVTSSAWIAVGGANKFHVSHCLSAYICRLCTKFIFVLLFLTSCVLMWSDMSDAKLSKSFRGTLVVVRIIKGN